MIHDDLLWPAAQAGFSVGICQLVLFLLSKQFASKFSVFLMSMYLLLLWLRVGAIFGLVVMPTMAAM